MNQNLKKMGGVKDPCLSKDLSDRVRATPHLLFDMDISQARGGSISNEFFMSISRLKLFFLRIRAAMAELPPDDLGGPTISMAPQSLPMTHMVTPQRGKALPKLCFDIFKAVIFFQTPSICILGCNFVAILWLWLSLYVMPRNVNSGILNQLRRRAPGKPFSAVRLNASKHFASKARYEHLNDTWHPWIHCFERAWNLLKSYVQKVLWSWVLPQSTQS